MRAMLVSVLTLAVALAGFSDDPPSGGFSRSGNAIVVDGNYTVEFQEFVNPVSGTEGTQLECQQDQIADADPTPGGLLPIEACTYPYTKAMGHIMSLPEADGQGYAVYFTDSGFSAEPLELAMLSGNSMLDWSFDNSSDCDGQFSDDGCNLDTMYDTLEIRLVSQDLAVATGGISSSGTFEVADAVKGVSFSASYDGKELTLTTSGIGNYTVDGWLVSEDEETGALTHADKFSVANGETIYEAPESIDSYAQVHLHVAGTKINLAVATIS